MKKTSIKLKLELDHSFLNAIIFLVFKSHEIVCHHSLTVFPYQKLEQNI